eukprot:CAMPEP_0168618604 /NCGR_PEP_ID=MMETSP0449_2-20121227/6158_1 /TAXON_ID=1082188 /ORGANISM="Strombidium rassoulzadegani, Strain ras09" /LENGTH=218 /DNA_ID=CAMNT_0008659485 /DNA_START=1070 /DNA_END=1724 /DNA_ORIENTATION=+
MTDFCYMANALLIIFLAFLPQNDYLFKACFFFANGSLAVAVGAFRNQMVFHKYDNLTSLALHIFPQVTTWNLRWSTMPQEVGVAEELRRVTELDTTFSFKKFYLVPVSIYMVWVSIYFIINFVVAAKRIRKRNYDNMFLLYEKKEWAQKIMYKFGAGMAPFIFISPTWSSSSSATASPSSASTASSSTPSASSSGLPGAFGTAPASTWTTSLRSTSNR